MLYPDYQEIRLDQYKKNRIDSKYNNLYINGCYRSNIDNNYNVTEVKLLITFSVSQKIDFVLIMSSII